MAHVAIPDQTKIDVVTAVRVGGMSYREAAAKYGVSHTSAKRWCLEVEAELAADAAAAGGGDAGPPPIKPVSHPPPEPEPDVDPEVFSDDPLTSFRAMQRQFLRGAAKAASMGNHEAAARAQGHAARMAPNIARLAHAAKENGDGVTYTRAELDAAVESVKEKVAALLSRPLCCARCGRELAADLAGLAKDAQARLFDPADIVPDLKKV